MHHSQSLKFNIASAALLTLTISAAPVQAQETKVIGQLVDATCTSFLAPVLGRKEIATLAAARGIDSRQVCSCANRSVAADSRLAPLLGQGDEAILRATEDLQLRSYVIGRVLNSVLQCFSQELDATLVASPIPK